MCKLLIAVKNVDGPNEQFNSIIRLQEKALRHENDGASAMIVNNEGKLEIFREYIDYSKVFSEVYSRLDTARIVAIHTRTGTSGEKGLTNVHFFEDANHIFAHNGFVSQYHSGYSYGYQGYNSTTTEQTIFCKMTDEEEAAANEISTCQDCAYFDGADWVSFKKCGKHKRETKVLNRFIYRNRDAKKNAERNRASKLSESDKKTCCDSFLFLKAITKPVISTQDLYNEMTLQKFTGMAFLMNKENFDSYLLIRNKEAACSLSDDKTFSMFFSYSPNLKLKVPIVKRVNGIAILEGEQDIDIDLEEKKILPGVHKFDFNNLLSPSSEITEGDGDEEKEVIYSTEDENIVMPGTPPLLPYGQREREDD